MKNCTSLMKICLRNTLFCYVIKILEKYTRKIKKKNVNCKRLIKESYVNYYLLFSALFISAHLKLCKDFNKQKCMEFLRH